MVEVDVANGLPNTLTLCVSRPAHKTGAMAT
jgi:hypothetical protein